MEKRGVVDASASGQTSINANDLVCALTAEGAADVAELAVFQPGRRAVAMQIDRERAHLIGRLLLDWSAGRRYADGPGGPVFSLVDGELTAAAAGLTGVDGELIAELPEVPHGPTAGPHEVWAAAVVTHHPLDQRLHSGFQLVMAYGYLLQVVLQRRLLGFKIAAAALKCRILRRDEPKTLLEDRRRAVFVDQRLQRLKKLRDQRGLW